VEGAVDEAVLNNIHTKGQKEKNPPLTVCSIIYSSKFAFFVEGA
jgi:hypothetical protein